MPENKVIIVSFDNKMMQESERTHNKTKFHFQMAAFIRTATKLSSLRTLTRLDFGRDFPQVFVCLTDLKVAKETHDLRVWSEVKLPAKKWSQTLLKYII